MTKSRYRPRIILLLCGDTILLYAALFGVLFFRYAYIPGEVVPIHSHAIPFTIIFIMWLILFGAAGLYDARYMRNNKWFLYRLIQTMAINTTLSILVLYFFIPSFEIEPRRNLFLIVGAATLLIFGWRSLVNLFLGRAPVSHIIFFGINNEILTFVEYLLANPYMSQKPVALFSTDDRPVPRSLPLPYYILKDHTLEHIIQNTGADMIVVSSDIKENKIFVKILFSVIPLGMGITEFSAFHEVLTGKIPISTIQEVWFLENLVGVKKRFYEFFKRVLDGVVATIAVCVALFTFPLIALAIKLDSAGPVFYRQRRIGRTGKEFGLVKYRTMVQDADQMSGVKGKEFDPRHTRVGRILRKSYLDELPQIINILRGEMSFVGPRPERPEYVERLKQKIPFYEMRLLVPPGITGWAQINMENDASVEDAPEKMQYDLYYIKNRSFILDLLIILRTIFTLLRREGR